MNSEILLIILIAALVNYFTRVLPFWFFRDHKPPAFILFIEQYFPAVIMVILVFYTVKDIELAFTLMNLKEVIAIVMTALTHLLFKNFLISIFSGTAFYMLWVQYGGG